MEGFEKIDLSTSPASIPSQTKDMVNANPSYARRKRPGFKKYFFGTRRRSIISFLVLFLILFSIFGVIIPAGKAIASAKKTYAQAKIAGDALKKQNVALASDELAKTKTSLAQTQKDLNVMFYLGYIPVVGWYYNDAQHLVKAGSHGLDAATVFVDSIEPYADVLGLKGQGSFVEGSAENRIQTAVRTMGKITPRIDDIISDLNKAKEEIDEVDTNRYPAIFIGRKARTNLDQMKKLADDGVTFMTDAKPLIKTLPELLGEPKEKKYLVIFQNDKELRPTGGFMTAYSVFRFDRGVVHVDSSSDIYTLDNTISGKPKAPAPIARYLPKVPEFNLRDTNLSPDFLNSMQTFNSLYKKAPGAPKVDGIIAVDTRALVGAMNILGDVEASGTKFTTKIDPRCDCPQVIYMLEVFSDQPVGYVRENRKGIIGDLMYAIMNKAFSSSPKVYWGPLFQEMVKQTAQKNVLFYSYNEDGQAGFEALNASGRIKSFEGDYLHINEANFGGAKANMFTTETVTQDYDVKSDGSIEKTVTIDFKNPYPPSDCNLERGGLCLNAPLREWIRVYVPRGSELINSRGSEVKVTSGTKDSMDEDLGKTVFEGFITVRPKGATKLTFTYRLPFKLDKSSSLPLLVQKQPGTDTFDYVVTSKNRQLNNFKLDTDKEIKLVLPR
ncbi:DUF4012 domain-containing protein [Patescibacteria group bacterium]|nr:DUF4012 domain-containing protein [Patescibacteria group bacterium]